MKYYTDENVFDAGLKRIRWLFQQFPNVIVNFSGGKDSTAVLNLTLRVAEELGRLPVPVLFIDQEAEWQSVIDYVRTVMADPRVEPAWLQVPFKIFNATSTREPWLHCWEPGAEWVRDKEPNSIHDNVFGTDRFGELFEAFRRHRFGDAPAISIAGVRTEESPARFKGLTSYETFGGETWGKAEDKKRKHYTFYPLYDWSYTDIWKAIHDHKWPYCAVYDVMYQYGVPIPYMRVSNFHHEGAVHQLFILQETESETWDRVARRIAGTNTAGQLQRQFFVTELPFMFKSWDEYLHHLIDTIVTEPKHQEYFRRTYESALRRYDPAIHVNVAKVMVKSVLVNDYHGTKLSSFQAEHGKWSLNAGSKGGDDAGSRAKRLPTKPEDLKMMRGGAKA